MACQLYHHLVRYAVWNNKGGVGKSFLSFVIATEWIKSYPEHNVLVVDMCPQANVSEILLGGNGDGSDHLAKLLENRKTIGGYFDKRINSPHEMIKPDDATDYALHVVDRNDKIPDNVYLVAGDPSLELQVQTINNLSVIPLPEDSWKNVHFWVKDLVESIIENKFGGKETLCILDCNPSFASYTEQAILAADRLIIPCSPDGSSARAIENVSRLVYGFNVPEQYRVASFRAQVDSHAIELPQIHSVVFNRSTIYSKKPSSAFQAMFDQVKNAVTEFMIKEKNHFSQSEEGTFCHMPDAHTVAVVASSLGIPLHKLRAGKHELYDGRETQIVGELLKRYMEKMREMINSLK